MSKIDTRDTLFATLLILCDRLNVSWEEVENKKKDLREKHHTKTYQEALKEELDVK